MKKLILSVFLTFAVGMVYALPVSNPIESSLYKKGICRTPCRDICNPCFKWLDAFDLRIGFYGDYVFNRNLQANATVDNSGNCVDTTTLFTNAGTLTLNICDWLDAYAVLGETSMNLITHGALFLTTEGGSINSAVDADFNTGFCWSVGGRATLWGYRCLAFGLEAQYFRASTTLNSFSDAMGYAYFNSNNQASYSEWQAGLGASYRFVSGCPEVSMVPYLAVKWSGSQFHVPPLTFTIPGIGATNTYTLRDLNNSRLWGYAVGMTATINSSFGVTAEGRWADESAVYVGSQLRF